MTFPGEDLVLGIPTHDQRVWGLTRVLTTAGTKKNHDLESNFLVKWESPKIWKKLGVLFDDFRTEKTREIMILGLHPLENNLVMKKMSEGAQKPSPYSWLMWKS